MKRTFTIFLLFVSLSVFGQFPTPSNFKYTLFYTYMNGCQNCCGMTGDQYYWCSTFSWNAPDTNNISSRLSYYNIYYLPRGSQTPIVIATSTKVEKSFYYGPTGEMWITAVYSSPNGESAPSNICNNYGLPIEVPIVKLTDKIKLHYDNILQLLKIQSTKNLTKLNLINTDGKAVKQIENPVAELNLTDLPCGFYVVEIYTSENEVFRQKIIK